MKLNEWSNFNTDAHRFVAGCSSGELPFILCATVRSVWVISRVYLLVISNGWCDWYTDIVWVVSMIRELGGFSGAEVSSTSVVVSCGLLLSEVGMFLFL